MSDETWREELKILAGAVDIQSSEYEFNWIKPYSFQISGTRTAIIDTNDITGFSFGQQVSNDFTYKIEFNEEGKVNKSVMYFQDNLGELMLQYGLQQLHKYGFAKSEGRINSDTFNDRSWDYKKYHILIDEKSTFYICLTIVLVTISLTICCVANICFKNQSKQVIYSGVDNDDDK